MISGWNSEITLFIKGELPFLSLFFKLLDMKLFSNISNKQFSVTNDIFNCKKSIHAIYAMMS